MPFYDYRCGECKRPVRLFFTYAEYDEASPRCTHCGSDSLKRVIRRVALATPDESRLDSFDADGMLAGLDKDDPRTLGKAMRTMHQEMGEDLGPEFNEVVERLESGQSPESIEKSMPDLADSAGSE
jgi:putative FmdB family regulatory protein